jgi:DNA-binding XRE family transcriptional regulator
MFEFFQKSDFEILEEIGSSVSKRRKLKGISQVSLAKQIGVNVSTIKAIEKGDGCHLKIFIKLIKYFDLETKLLKALYIQDLGSPKVQFNDELRTLESSKLGHPESNKV